MTIPGFSDLDEYLCNPIKRKRKKKETMRDEIILQENLLCIMGL